MPLAVNVTTTATAGPTGLPRVLTPWGVAGTTTFDEVDVKQLASGDNVFTVPSSPASPVGVIIVPPSGNAIVLTLKGAAGDTGLKINKTVPTVWFFDPVATPATFIVNAASGFAPGVLMELYWF